MIVDARTIPDGATLGADICIIGAGAAGITIAREFIARPFEVCLLESGGLEPDKDTEALNEGESSGLPYLLTGSRLRYFGGTTNHWGGWCQPLDEQDFETREWVPYSGWPFGFSHLVPFYRRAQSIMQLGPFAYDAEDWVREGLFQLGSKSARVISKVIQLSPPTRFGSVYRGDIQGADNITAYLHANAVELRTNGAGQTVKKVDVACLDGRRFAVAAKKFILAAGGIENARILLVSRKVQKAGLGNDRDLVGRFFMEHPFLKSAQFLPANPYGVGLYKSSKVAPKVGSLGSTQAETLIKGCLKLSPDALRREQLLNFRATLEPTYADGLASLDHIVGTMAGGDLPDDFLSHLGNVIRDIDHIVHAGYGRLTRGTYPVRLLEVFSCIEQAPNPDSRVMLSTECDGLGMPRVKLQWALTPIDRTTIRRANDILAEEMGRGGEGRLKITLQEDNWPQAHDVGFHHMGTTRMHPNPQSGVVDANCLVHGLSNLYIAGSSVFPTCGSANPTLTIVALAIRLASHLQEHLS